MGGNSGTIIVNHAVKATLSDPIVSGHFPAWLALLISPALAKDEVQWTITDKVLLAHAMSWCLLNL